MKKSFLFLLSTVLFVGAISAQKKSDIRLNGYAGYIFDDAIDSYYDANNYYNGKIMGAFQWGVGIESKINRGTGVELLYMRQDTKAPMKYLGGAGLPKNKDFNIGMNYIMLGINRYFGANPKVEPYVGPMLGMAIASIKNPDPGGSSSITKFAWGVRGGANIWASPKVAIKLQMQLLSATQGFGGGAYFGTGGVGVGLQSYSSVLQFGLGGGLAFKLGN
jgi:hypothetical protein